MKFTQKAVSLFSGCGGFCEGIKQAGFKLACAVELDRFASETYRHNFPSTPLFEGDVRDFLAPGSDHVEKFKLHDIDLVFGGPPCQGFSQIGPRDIGDHRNQLYEEFGRVIFTLRPKIFLMENVPNLLLLHRGLFRDKILELFRTNGYSNTTFVRVKASDFRVPQDRNRVIFVGTRDDVPVTGLQGLLGQLVEKERSLHTNTVGEAITDLPDKVVASGETMPYPRGKKLSSFQREMRIDTDGEIYSAKQKGSLVPKLRLHNHHTKEIQKRRAHLITFLAPGAKADSLPKHIWNGARPEKWRRLNPETPAYTILAQMHRDLSEWVHPSAPRWITVREAARLQSFHDGFVFVGSEWQQLKQIGNAVPPLLAYSLGRVARGLLANAKRESHKAAKEPAPIRATA
jgi:DNA (cytosine-5)-methyltransferase 1